MDLAKIVQETLYNIGDIVVAITDRVDKIDSIEALQGDFGPKMVLAYTRSLRIYFGLTERPEALKGDPDPNDPRN